MIIFKIENLTHNTTPNEEIDDIFRNTHAPARSCHVHGGSMSYLLIWIADFKKVLTTTSITKDISKTDRLINKNAQMLSLSGSKSALHRFM